jgi:hypothetical protein
MEVEVEEVDDAAIKATSKDVERRKGEQEEEVASLQKKKAKKQKMKRSKEEKKGEKKQKSKRRRVREDEEKDQGGLRQKVRNLLGLAKKPLYDEPSVVLLQTLWRGRVARKQLHIHSTTFLPHDTQRHTARHHTTHNGTRLTHACGTQRNGNA